MSEHKREGQAGYSFSATEYSDGTPWILCEPMEQGLPILKGHVFGIQLRPGTTMKEAEQIAEYLRHNVDGFSSTRL